MAQIIIIRHYYFHHTLISGNLRAHLLLATALAWSNASELLVSRMVIFIVLEYLIDIKYSSGIIQHLYIFLDFYAFQSVFFATIMYINCMLYIGLVSILYLVLVQETE